MFVVAAHLRVFGGPSILQWSATSTLAGPVTLYIVGTIVSIKLSKLHGGFKETLFFSLFGLRDISLYTRHAQYKGVD